MKRLVFLLCPIACGVAMAAQAPQFAEIHSVYLLPMSGGLDQFLANRLTGENALRVVTDPRNADALFTDKLGEAFEGKYAELYPPPPAPEPEKAATEAKDAQKAKYTKDATKGEASGKSKDFKEEPRSRSSSFGRGRGTIFLVDRKTRAVIWSTYTKPKNSTPDELDRAARRIVDRLKKELLKK